MTTEPNEPEPRWDWISTILVILGVVIVLALTFEIWAPHYGMQH